MAHPKRKISKTRRDKRRTHYKASSSTMYTCPNCNAAVMYHRVCEECGHYRGKQAIDKQ
ncbi:MAG: 50S ribosomal protein L32 [Bacteroidota bacterium]|nr:50S ribosomal protein L32 [Bacteroidota bacterium]